MTLPKYTELTQLNKIDEIEKEIFVLTKNLFDLRIKRSTNQQIKSHIFTHTKRRISQLKYKQSFLVKLEK
jgi:ribosomal protein L29